MPAPPRGHPQGATRTLPPGRPRPARRGRCADAGMEGVVSRCRRTSGDRDRPAPRRHAGLHGPHRNLFQCRTRFVLHPAPTRTWRRRAPSPSDRRPDHHLGLRHSAREPGGLRSTLRAELRDRSGAGQGTRSDRHQLARVELAAHQLGPARTGIGARRRRLRHRVAFSAGAAAIEHSLQIQSAVGHASARRSPALDLPHRSAQRRRGREANGQGCISRRVGPGDAGVACLLDGALRFELRPLREVPAHADRIRDPRTARSLRFVSARCVERGGAGRVTPATGSRPRPDGARA